MPIEALYGIAAFSGFSLFLGWRLLRLVGRGGGLPEAALGTAFVFSGGIGALLQAPPALDLGPESFQRASFAVVRLSIDLGIACQMLFTWQVFRPGERWARGLFAAVVASLALLYAVYASIGELGNNLYRGVWFWVEVPVHLTGIVWAAWEALRYHRVMRRRLALGLADPVVTNRFLLWGVALSASAVALAIPPVVQLITPDPAFHTWIPTLCAVPASLTVVGYALTFFPPAAYRRLLERRALEVLR